MCYSSETSRNFFIINIICSYMLYKIPYFSSDNKIIALYFIYVILKALLLILGYFDKERHNLSLSKYVGLMQLYDFYILNE